MCVGVSLNLGGPMTVWPKLPEATQLQQWFESGGQTTEVQSLTTNGGVHGPIVRYALPY